MNISYVKNMGTLHNMLKARTTAALDLSDILRAELVMAVSALDYYVHEIVELGVEEMYTKKRPPTSRFLDFRVSLGDFWKDNSVLASHNWLIDEVRTRHSFKSFQRPDNIAEAIRLFSTVSLWEEVSKKVGTSAQDVKDRLELIVDRRNKIAHEADADPTVPGSRWPINTAQVEDAVNFIERIGDAFFQILK